MTSKWLKGRCRQCQGRFLREEFSLMDGKYHRHCFACGAGDAPYRPSELAGLEHHEVLAVLGQEGGLIERVLPRINTPGATPRCVSEETFKRMEIKIYGTD